MSASRQRSIGYRFCKGFSLKANRTTTNCQMVHGRAAPSCSTKFLMQPENQNGATTVCHHPPPTSRQNRRSGIDARPTRSVTTPIQHTKRQPENEYFPFSGCLFVHTTTSSNPHLSFRALSTAQSASSRSSPPNTRPRQKCRSAGSAQSPPS